jgi:hypothetical protein
MNDSAFAPRRARRLVPAIVALGVIAAGINAAHAFKLPKWNLGQRDQKTVSDVGKAAEAAARRAIPAGTASKLHEIDSTLAGTQRHLEGTADQPPLAPGAAASPAAPVDTTGLEAGLLDQILLSPEPYYYESLGRRDPFVSLISDAYLQDSDEEDRTGPDDLVVVGVLWGDGDRYALVETPEGKSLILREGDRYGPATVTRINPDGVALYVNQYGVGRTLRLQVIDPKKKRTHHDSRER